MLCGALFDKKCQSVDQPMGIFSSKHQMVLSNVMLRKWLAGKIVPDNLLLENLEVADVPTFSKQLVEKASQN